MPQPLIRVHTDAVIANLVAVLGPLTIQVGDSEAPGAAMPFAVVHFLPTGPADGTLSDPDADITLQYQISSWGLSREQSQGVADSVRTAMLDTPIVIAGRGVMRVEVSSGGTFADRDLGESPTLFHTPDRYLVRTTPA